MREKTKNLEQIINKLITSFVGIDYEQFDAVINQALKSIGEFFDADRVYLFDYDFNAMTFTNTYEWCALAIEPMIDTLQNRSLDGLDYWLENHLSGKETYIANVKELDENDPVRKILEPQHILSLLTIPMMNKKECYGFLGIDSVKETRRYTNAERETLIKFGKVLTLFQQKQINEKKLNQTQSLLMSILDNQKEYVCRINRNNNTIVYANQSFLEDIGSYYSLAFGDDLFKSELFSIVHVHEFLSHFSASNQKLTFEQEIMDKKNNTHMIMWEFYPLEFEDEIQVVGFNISTLKHALRDSDDCKQKMQYMFTSSKVGTWQYDVVEKRLLVDDLFAQSLGYKKEEINSLKLHQLTKLIDSKDIQKVLKVVHEITNKKLTTFDVNLSMIHKDGSALLVNESGYTQSKKYRSNVSKIIGFHRNISESLESVMDTKAFQTLFDEHDKMVVISDVDNTIKHANNEFYFVTGYSYEDIVDQKTEFFMVNAQNNHHIKSIRETLQKHETWQGDLHVKNKQGDLIHCNTTIIPSVDEGGVVVRYVSIYEQIVEKH